MMHIRTDRKFPKGYAKIVAFDPGGMTGVCIGTLVSMDDGPLDIEFEFKSLRYPDDMSQVAGLLEAADLVILEDFNLFPGHFQKGVMTGPEAKGFIFASCQIKSIPVVLQQPGVQNKRFRNFIREHVGDRWPDSDHEQSALCHLLYYLEGKD